MKRCIECIVIPIAIIIGIGIFEFYTWDKIFDDGRMKYDIKQFATCANDMLYTEHDLEGKTTDEVRDIVNHKYLPTDYRLDSHRDIWGCEYKIDYATVNTSDNDGNMHECTYILINSKGKNKDNESGGVIKTITKNNNINAEEAIERIDNAGDDIGAIILRRDGNISKAYYGIEMS